MKNKIVMLAIFVLLTFSLSLGSASLTYVHSIASNGLITYPGDPPLRVQGKLFVDALNNQVLLRGFNLWTPNVFEPEFHPLLSLERFKEIKSWGFNTMSIPVNWKYVEPYKDQVGAYSEENLQKMEQIIDWCGQSGLYVVISFRIIAMWWASSWDDQEYTLEWVQTEEAQQRYQNVLTMLVQRFDEYDNVIGFNGWFFPFHGYIGKWWDPAWEDCYYNVYTPIIVNTIRAYSNKIIFYSPCYQGGTPIGTVSSESLDTGQFALITPLNDDNVVYTHRLHRGRGVNGNARGVEDGDEWDYDYAYLERQIQPAIDFMNTYDVPLCAIEFGLVTQNQLPIKQSRLDCQDYKFELMNNTGSYHWTYWLYGDPSAEEGILNNDLTPNAVGLQIINWAQTTT